MSAKIINRHERQSSQRKQRTVRPRFLIVCEGEETEPNYFNALTKDNKSISCKIKGKGKNTIYLVEEAIKLKENNDFDKVWVVFDKDSFPNEHFNNAITKAESNGIECAWSNEAFELWFLYHFENIREYLQRSEYSEKISHAVNNSEKYKKDNKNKKYKYQKKDEKNFSIMTSYGSQENAIKWAEKQSEKFTDKNYATHNPCTMVFRLVKQLIGQDKELNQEIDSIVEGKNRR